jgi:quaternary ammonium compound-resistance protein SugE
MAWTWIWAAAACEVVWALGLKASDHFKRPGPTALTIVAYLASLWFLSLGMRKLPVGTAYAVWTGVGAAGAAIGGMILYGESREPVRVVFLLVIAAGVAGLMATEGR